MKHATFVLALATAVAGAPMATSAYASANHAPDRGRSPEAHGTFVRNPDGELVRPGHGHRRTPPARHGTAAPPPSPTATTTTAGTACVGDAGGAIVCRAGAAQSFPTGGGTDGAYMTTTVQSPWVDTKDNHSLVELSVVKSTDPSTRADDQIIEVGWRVAPKWHNGDQTPRLFVYYWINGQYKDCYDGCAAFQPDSSTTIRPGMTLTSGSTATFQIQHYQGNWWIGYNNTWFGYFPDSTWSGTYTRANVVYAFGEVSTTVTNPITNMGNGNFGTSTAAATITNVGFYNGSAAPYLSTFADNVNYYNAQLTSTNSLRFGGPGAG